MDGDGRGRKMEKGGREEGGREEDREKGKRGRMFNLMCYRAGGRGTTSDLVTATTHTNAPLSVSWVLFPTGMWWTSRVAPSIAWPAPVTAKCTRGGITMRGRLEMTPQQPARDLK